MTDSQDRPDGDPTPPAKKAPPVKKAAKAPAKKTPAKKAPAKKAPAPELHTNGQLAAAAKATAAQAKSNVDGANGAVPRNGAVAAPSRSPVPVVVAIALSMLALLLIRQLRRR